MYIYTLGDLKDLLAIVGFLAFLLLSYILKAQTFILLMRLFCIVGFIIDFIFVICFINHINLRHFINKFKIRYYILYIILVFISSFLLTFID